MEERIRDLSWFKSTKLEIQSKLLNLPESANGFISDLLDRPIRGGGVLILSLEELLYSPFDNIFSITPIFKVQSLANLEIVYHYEYHSWKQGPESGSKGLLLLQDNKRITHIVLLTGFKFAPGKDVYDIIGGFSNPDETGIKGMIQRFNTEIKEELGMPEIRVNEIIPLGRLMPDSGLTNNHPNLFAAIIDGSDVNIKEYKETANPDPFEMRVSIMVIPVEILNDFIWENDDGYFLACIARLGAKSII
ncbi:MAG: hypothetical protein KAI71_01465 [Candidatus Pacebacteria bacterium]|nr:hypothetical protein [Candidatus Paceibacterota bacterium]